MGRRGASRVLVLTAAVLVLLPVAAALNDKPIVVYYDSSQGDGDENNKISTDEVQRAVDDHGNGDISAGLGQKVVDAWSDEDAVAQCLQTSDVRTAILQWADAKMSTDIVMSIIDIWDECQDNPCSTVDDSVVAPYDSDGNSEISIGEVQTLIDDWANNKVSDDTVTDGITAWAEGCAVSTESDEDGGDDGDGGGGDGGDGGDSGGNNGGSNGGSGDTGSSGPTDSDGDGTSDSNDPWPNDPSRSKDSDGDGVADSNDPWPNDSSKSQDSDGDGVADSNDDFPNDPGATSDRDGDGYADSNEACPDTSSRYPGNYNGASCPDRYRWVCDGDTTRTQEKKNRWAPQCGNGCSSDPWTINKQESPQNSQYECRDPDGDGGDDAAWVDVVPPTTTDTSDDAWHRREQSITLTCDDGSGSGCAKTAYCVDRSNSCTPATRGSTVEVTQEGTTFIRYRSTDSAGNTEAVQSTTVRIDRTPPSIACDGCDKPDPVRTGQPISFGPAISDPLSGPASMEICEGEGGTADCSELLCSGTTSCTFGTPENTYDTRDYWIRATDTAGNTAGPVHGGNFTIKKWLGDLCTSDSSCLLGSCVEDDETGRKTCEADIVSQPGISIR
ncbi:MAG: hypothetical protein SVW02_02510 [Candidatus Nanohaloarchaea archaeon]|nr:hypothetical protein [Candidatus Nanohaloarchaea archaeon]